jgi:hypothetical protein
MADPAGKQPVQTSLYAGRVSSTKRRPEAWKRPNEGWRKVNVDGTFCSSTSSGGVGVVIRDHNGAVLLAAWKAVPIARMQRKWRPWR